MAQDLHVGCVGSATEASPSTCGVIKMSRIHQIALVALLALSTLSTASAAPVFQGRLADGSASTTCTVSGPTKCTMFYNTTLDITILNNWNIGRGFWSASAVAGSAQALAESAGFSATGLTGWVLPTGANVGGTPAQNQFLSIWNDVGSTLAGLRNQFDGVLLRDFWSSSEYALNTQLAWGFSTVESGFQQGIAPKNTELYAVAVRRGNVTATVPEPQSLALVMLALAAGLVARRLRPR